MENSIPKWLKQTISREQNDSCSECGEYFNKNELCYTNKNSCLWCKDCAENEAENEVD